MIDIKNLTKTYITGEVETKVLKGIDLHIKSGEFVAIMGKSGAGKSTLLYQMSLLDIPTSGKITINGVNILELSETKRTDFRLNKLGYIFQDYALVPELTADENVAVPLLMQQIEHKEAHARAHKALDDIDMQNKYHNRPNQLSGGEQQRVSIARAVVQNPEILFADEPTANLDSVSSNMVIDVLHKLHQAGQTIVMVTHEPEYTKYCDRIISLKDGLIVDHDYKI